MLTEDLFANLTDEQKEKAKSCNSSEELVAFAQEEGIDLTDDQLDAVSGGATWNGCWNRCTEDCPSNCCVCPQVGVAVF